MIVDTHVHLDDDRYTDDLDDILNRAYAEGVGRFIIPGADPSTLQRAVDISERYEDVFFAVGVHPYDAHSYDRVFLERFVSHEKCVAVGECGLDYYRLPRDEESAKELKKIQKEVFADQIELAKSCQKPLIVHIRDASRDSQNLLESLAGTKGGVLHCYNADHQLLKLSEKGFYFGIGGVVTFKNAKKLTAVLPKIPSDRLLIETDGPYLTPHPYRGKRNEPAYCRLILEKMARLTGVSEDELELLCRENTMRLFRI